MTFSQKPRTPRSGLFACLAVAICVLLSGIGCGIARFDLSITDESAETALATSAGNAERTDPPADLLPSVHKTFDALALHHRTLPHRTRSLTPSRWWHHPPTWPTPGNQRITAHDGATAVSATGRKLLTQLCISQR